MLHSTQLRDGNFDIAVNYCELFVCIILNLSVGGEKDILIFFYVMIQKCL
jgi:hypothetical protein